MNVWLQACYPLQQKEEHPLRWEPRTVILVSMEATVLLTCSCMEINEEGCWVAF